MSSMYVATMLVKMNQTWRDENKIWAYHAQYVTTEWKNWEKFATIYNRVWAMLNREKFSFFQKWMMGWGSKCCYSTEEWFWGKKRELSPFQHGSVKWSFLTSLQKNDEMYVMIYHDTKHKTTLFNQGIAGIWVGFAVGYPLGTYRVKTWKKVWHEKWLSWITYRVGLDWKTLFCWSYRWGIR